MTAMTVVLPYERASFLHIPRRDLVLSAADCVDLRVTVVESDDPSAQALVLTGGLGGPALTVAIWRDSPSWAWDYGAPKVPYGDVLWSGQGVPADAIGSFDVHIDAGTLAAFPLRCGWSVRLFWDAVSAETLAEGVINVRPAFGPGRPASADVITIDGPPLDPITTD